MASQSAPMTTLITIAFNHRANSVQFTTNTFHDDGSVTVPSVEAITEILDSVSDKLEEMAGLTGATINNENDQNEKTGSAKSSEQKAAQQ